MTLGGSAGASSEGRGVLGEGAGEVFWETAAMSWPAEFTPRLYRGRGIYVLGQRFSACFASKIAPQGRGREKGGSANHKNKAHRTFLPIPRPL